MYRTIDCATWGDPWFEELQPAGKLLFLYLITNNRTSMSGAYPITLRTMANETCLTQERVSELLGTFGDRVVWWPDHACIFIKNFYRHQRSNSSDKYRIGAAKQTLDLPDVVRESVWITYPELRQKEIPTAYPMDTLSVEQNRLDTETETETETKQSKAETDEIAPPPQRAKRATQIPQPFDLTDEMYDWAQEQGIPRDVLERESLKFVNYYLGNGKPMKDWSATWENWQLRAQENKAQGRWTGRQNSLHS